MSYSELKVLLVEDNDSIRFLTEAMLSQLGVGTIVSCTNYYEVQERLGSTEVDGAFLDLVLEHGSGLDIARLLATKKIPTVFTTGVTDDYNMQQMYRYGFVFNKPVTMYMINRALVYFQQVKAAVSCGNT